MDLKTPEHHSWVFPNDSPTTMYDWEEWITEATHHGRTPEDKRYWPDAENVATVPTQERLAAAEIVKGIISKYAKGFPADNAPLAFTCIYGDV